MMEFQKICLLYTSLSEYKDCFSVFVHADTDWRINRLSQKHNKTAKEAKDMINKTDKAAVHGTDWKRPKSKIMTKAFLIVSVACNVWFLFLLFYDRIMDTKLIRFFRHIAGLWRSLDSTVAEQGKDKEIPHADTSDIIGKSRFKMAPASRTLNSTYLTSFASKAICWYWSLFTRTLPSSSNSYVPGNCTERC